MRELRNAVSQAVILSSTGIIDSSHLPDKLSAARKTRETENVVISTPQVGAADAADDAAAGCNLRSSRLSGAQIQLSLETGLDAMVVQIMQRTLEVCNGNVTRAAQILGNQPQDDLQPAAHRGNRQGPHVCRWRTAGNDARADFTNSGGISA